MDRAPELSPTTETGTVLVFVEFVPSWPLEFAPQQKTPPESVRAHVWKDPAEMATTPAPTSGTVTGTGNELSKVEPMPSWPTSFLPQQNTRPSGSSIAQVCRFPAVRERTCPVRPVTATGTWLSTVEP